MINTHPTIPDTDRVSKGSANQSIRNLAKLEGFVDTDVIAVAYPSSKNGVNPEGFVYDDVIADADLI